MHSFNIRASMIALALLATAGTCLASPQSGNCLISSTAGARGVATKSCSRCQWECLTDPIHCTGLTFDGTYTPFDSLSTWSCGDNYWMASSPGMCVLYDLSDKVFDTQEQDCTACLHQCATDSRCGYTTFNYVNYEKSATTCAAVPPTPTASPSLAVPSPSPVAPSVEPSPMPVAPPAVPVVPVALPSPKATNVSEEVALLPPSPKPSSEVDMEVILPPVSPKPPSTVGVEVVLPPASPPKPVMPSPSSVPVVPSPKPAASPAVSSPVPVVPSPVPTASPAVPSPVPVVPSPKPAASPAVPSPVPVVPSPKPAASNPVPTAAVVPTPRPSFSPTPPTDTSAATACSSPAAALPLPADAGATGECKIYGKGGNVITSSTVSCEQCQWQCLTWGTEQSDCHAVSFAGSAQIPRDQLAYGLCPAAMAAANQPINKDTYGLCVLKKGDLIKDTQMMHCWTCVEQCGTWSECETMVFNTHTVSRAQLEGYCECASAGGSSGSGRRLLL